MRRTPSICVTVIIVPCGEEERFLNTSPARMSWPRSRTSSPCSESARTVPSSPNNPAALCLPRSTWR
jgi:hypothetical protein